MTNAGDLQGRIPFSGKLPEELFCVAIGVVNPGSSPGRALDPLPLQIGAMDGQDMA
jgi:hypothetical protein